MNAAVIDARELFALLRVARQLNRQDQQMLLGIAESLHSSAARHVPIVDGAQGRLHALSGHDADAC